MHNKETIILIFTVISGIVLGIFAFLIIRHIRDGKSSSPRCVKNCGDNVCGDSNCPGENCGTCSGNKKCQSGKCITPTSLCEGKTCGDNDHCTNGCYCDKTTSKCKDGVPPPPSDCYTNGINPFDPNNNCAKKCCSGKLCKGSDGYLTCGDCTSPIIPDCKSSDTSDACCSSTSYCPSGCNGSGDKKYECDGSKCMENASGKYDTSNCDDACGSQPASGCLSETNAKCTGQCSGKNDCPNKKNNYLGWTGNIKQCATEANVKNWGKDWTYCYNPHS